MFYLSVAAGGALGSMARAWLAIAVARITGPQFPWGTILINIVGSFVIGFFGTLTTNESRFAVAPDFRAFVMIGICGGFTTFSSFSLQTLDLARDGRMAQALGNIALSVVLCLAAVSAGHYSAASLHRRPAGQAARTADTGEVVVALLNRPEQAQILLDVGAEVLQGKGGGRLTALAVRMPPAAAILPSEEVLTASREAAIRAEQENWAGQLHSTVEAWASRARPRSILTDWRDVEGDAAEQITSHGNRADTIVLARPAPHEGERMRDALHAALFDTGCPVLVVPPGFSGGFGRTVAIAWRNDDRAAMAVRASIPILRRADVVHVLSANRAAEMPAILQQHAIPAQLHSVPDGEGSAAERILAVAHRLGADLLVMGAFAHGEWRERVFGGVTRTMLASADLPLLMRH